MRGVAGRCLVESYGEHMVGASLFHQGVDARGEPCFCNGRIEGNDHVGVGYVDVVDYGQQFCGNVEHRVANQRNEHCAVVVVKHRGEPVFRQG